MTISLQNKKILVTRESQAAEQFAEKIRAYGGEPIITPLLEIRGLPYTLEGITERVREKFDWVFFTSANGVNCFMQQSPQLEGCRIAAVGPKTKKAIEAYHYTVDFMPSTYNADVMAAEFLETYGNTHNVLFVRGNLSRPVLLDAFTKANVPYECVEVYETATNCSIKKTLCEKLQQEIDFFTFTSPSTVNAFVQLTLGIYERKDIPVVCIGTTTEERAKEVGFTHTITPKAFTIEGMLDVLGEEIERMEENE